MGQYRGVFVLGAEQPGAEVVEGTVALERHFPSPAGISTRGADVAVEILVEGIAFRTSGTALLAGGPVFQRLVFAVRARGLGHDEVGYVAWLAAPRFGAVAASPALGAGLVLRAVRAPSGGVSVAALGELVLGGLEVEKNKFLDRFFGLFGKEEASVVSRDPGPAALA